MIIKWCVYAIIFAAPFSKSISEASIAIAITFWLVNKALNRNFRLERTDLNLPFAIFLITVIPSLFVSNYHLLSLRAFFAKVLKFVLLYFVIVENMNTKSKLKDLFIIALISMIIIMTDGLVQYYGGCVDFLHKYPAFKYRLPDEGFFKGFPTASFPYPNDFAAWMLLTLTPLACVTMFSLKNKNIRYLTAFICFGLLYLFFLTKARGAWIALAVSVIYIALSKKKIWLLILIAAFIILPFIFRMEMAEYIFGFGSIGDRFSMWGTGWEIFKNHPLIGNGLNTFFLEFKEYRNDKWKGLKGSYAHNCYLQMAADTGLVGLAGFVWLMLSYFFSVVKRLKDIKDEFYGPILWGISIGAFAFLIHSFFDTNLYSLNLATLFWCAIGISGAILKLKNE